ncbi:uncharacterized protein LOC115322562 [Ixodes scapularis]|uniref:uncharacterized protein LOC115322562 n=1 Tax=Ixodes scapularis TaxID=6945 RepID=UPI001C3853A6|nr:uncharacterized protein LOC115322562 [Ixodes scapularis]
MCELQLCPDPQNLSNLEQLIRIRIVKMAGSSICFPLLATMFQWATASSSECDQTPLATFDLNKMINCGFNGESWSISNVPGEPLFCGANIIDKTSDGNLLSYDIDGRTCNRLPFIYSVRNGANETNFLERDLGNGVSRYVTYKSTWTSAGKDQLAAKAATNSALDFVQDYTFDCANGNV